MSDNTPKPVRSPSYPSLSLQDSVELTKTIYDQYRGTAVDREIAAKLIGYSTLSGPASKTLAALSAYGLVERAGTGELRVSDRAKDILYGDAAERAAELAAAANEPKLFRKLNDRFAGIIPPEDGVANFLSREGYSARAVKPACKAYLATMRYIGEQGAEAHSNVSPIQMEHSTFNAPPFEGVQLPSTELESTEPQKSLSAGYASEQEWMKSHLGQETYIRLLVSGPIGPKQIGKLIRLLEAQKSVLEDD